jgi:bifunctional DNA-binding transcriptional regulator/antitoxin component of YhaV-PrlF toxin-antitoxin module
LVFLLVFDFWVFGLWFVLERFVARVLQGGKVTIPKRLRELLGVEDGDYLRLGLVEVIDIKKR